ncbi:MAG: hypothetical protein V1932_00545 [Chloroflexota bacterium]
MSPRQKKPQVKVEQAQNWLERNESGESPPKIASTDGYDPRTVRKYLETAKQERESKEARGTVLRGALERHYAALCRYAERLTVRSSGGFADIPNESAISDGRYEGYLGAALREHLPRSPIWGYLSRRAKLNTRRVEIATQLRSMVETSLPSDPGLSQLTDEENGVVPGLIDALKIQSERWAQGLPGLNVTDHLKLLPAEDGFVNMQFGPFPLGKVRSEHQELAGTAITEWTTRIKQWEEYSDIVRTLQELERLEEKLNDEIAVIALRGIVPGRCKYCPL